MSERLQISVVLPAYNEAENLKAVVTELRAVLAERFERELSERLGARAGPFRAGLETILNSRRNGQDD